MRIDSSSAVLRCIRLALLICAIRQVASSAIDNKWDVYRGQGFSVRTKQTSRDVCLDDTISGYVDWGDNHMFFWAAESRSKNANDPVILWLTGGPGASGFAFGGLEELGPCLWSGADGLAYNPYAWNSNATVIFVDQPLGVGFSHGQRVRTLRESTDHLEAFVERLFAAKPDWAARDFYIAGESYGGSYVPALAAQIHRSNSSLLMDLVSRTSSRGKSKINLKGMLIGNGLMDQAVQRRGFYEMGCVDNAILNATQCRAMAEAQPRCERLEAACRESGYDRAVCNMSDAFCQQAQWFQIEQTPWYPYDVRINCTKFPDRCVDPPTGLINWLNEKRVREAFGADDEADKFAGSSDQVFRDFFESGEVGYPSHPWVTEILDAGMKVLIYAGNKDWLCSAPGMLRFVDSLSWSGNAQFEMAPFLPVFACDDASEPCRSGKRLWGYHKRYENFSYMEVDEAGHLVLKNQPAVALAMVNYWIAGVL